MTKTYTLTRRFDNVVLETGVEGYLSALSHCEAYPHCDVIIHADGTDWMEEKRKEEIERPYDITQAGWAFI